MAADGEAAVGTDLTSPSAASPMDASPPAPGAEGGGGGGGEGGRPARKPRERQEIPDMTVEEAKAKLSELGRLEKPDEEAHTVQVSSVYDAIKKLKERVEAIKGEMDSISQNRSGNKDGFAVARNVMKELRAERDLLQEELDRIGADRAAAKAAVDKHVKVRKDAASELKYTSAAEIDDAIAKLEKKQQTQSMSLAEEKKLIKEIESLRQSKKTVVHYAGAEEQIRTAKDSVEAVRKTENDKWAEMKALKDKMAEQKKVLDELSKAREAEGNPMGVLIAERNALRDEMSALHDSIKEIRTEYRAAVDAWYAHGRQVSLYQAAIRKAEYKARRAVEDERRKAFEAEEAKKIPYEEEMALCEALAAYLENTFLKDETTEAAATAAAARGDQVGVRRAAAGGAQAGGRGLPHDGRWQEEGRRQEGQRRRWGKEGQEGGRKGQGRARACAGHARILCNPPPDAADVAGRSARCHRGAQGQEGLVLRAAAGFCAKALVRQQRRWRPGRRRRRRQQEHRPGARNRGRRRIPLAAGGRAKAEGRGGRGGGVGGGGSAGGRRRGRGGGGGQGRRGSGGPGGGGTDAERHGRGGVITHRRRCAAASVAAAAASFAPSAAARNIRVVMLRGVTIVVFLAAPRWYRCWCSTGAAVVAAGRNRRQWRRRHRCPGHRWTGSWRHRRHQLTAIARTAIVIRAATAAPPLAQARRGTGCGLFCPDETALMLPHLLGGSGGGGKRRRKECSAAGRPFVVL
ncbi:unnamed protein product [Phaeothamnion confervicola]